ncbi:MAG: DUF2798 domain-containing protein [Pseudomonadales bacterium]|nr:DUF2798 domain-containing protein [Pseudomonadales bacterium]
MSLVISIFNFGLIEGIISIWIKAWGFAFIIAFPIVRKLVALIVENNEESA